MTYLSRGVNDHTKKGNSDVVPKDVSVKVKEITNRERLIQELGSNCKAQVNEIKNRTAILNQYATNLIEIDKNIKRDRASFEQDYNSRLTEVSSQITFSTESYEQLSIQLQHIISANIHSEQMKKKFIQNIEIGEGELKALHETLKKYDEYTDNNTYEDYENSNSEPHISIKKLKIKLKKVNDDIAEQKESVELISNLVEQLSTRRKDACKHTEELEMEIESKLTNNRVQLKNIREKLSRSSGQKVELTDIDEQLNVSIDVLQQKNQKLSAKIAYLDKKEGNIIRSLTPLRERDFENKNVINSIKEEAAKFISAKEARITLFKNIEVSKQRASCRSNEIAAEISTTRQLKKKAIVEAFELEATTNRMIEDEDSININIEKANQELSVVSEEEDKIMVQYNTTNDYVREIENDDLAYEQTKEGLKSSLKDLKSKIKEHHEEEKLLVQQYHEVKQSSKIDILPEIIEVRTSFDNIINGYNSKLIFVRDGNIRLQQLVETEMLRNQIGNSEMKRINISMLHASSHLNGNTELRPTLLSQTFTQSLVQQNLQVEVNRLQDLVKIKSENVHRLHTNVSHKTTNLAKQDKFTKAQGELIKRQQNAEKAVEVCKSFFDRIMNLYGKFKADMKDYQCTLALNSWNNFISDCLMEADELELKFRM